MDEEQWIAGGIAVESALAAGRRTVSAVLVQRDRLDGRVARVQRLARQRGVVVERLTVEEMAARAPVEPREGLLARVGPRRLAALADLLAEAGAAPALVMLDGVEDPYNFGQAVRALYAAGIDGLVVRARNWLSAGTVIRASAGASEFMPAAVTESAEAAAVVCWGRGLRVLVADETGEPMYDVDLRGPLLLVVGGEKRGITRSFLATADRRVRIPYGRAFPHALGAAGAATVLGFEMMRQRADGQGSRGAEEQGRH
jgi:23S rRNA (guanosine2251-2'-O)-methyltransferase